ncbi:conserved hypothetical protein [Klebsiella variicola]|nr:conserved hypothetical protein [Klebsiella variicola]
MVREFNASYVAGDSVWLRTIHQEISYATTQKLKKQSQLPHQMYLPWLHQPIRTQLHPSPERLCAHVSPL